MKKKLLAILLIFVLVLTATSTFNFRTVGAAHPYPKLLDYSALDSSYDRLASDYILTDFKKYILQAIKYHIESSESDYRIAKTLMKARVSGEDGTVIFFFDGCSTNLLGTETCFSGFTKNGRRYNDSAVCIVVQVNSSGIPQIVFATKNASTMPDNVRDDYLNGGLAPGILRDGVYDVVTIPHHDIYAGFNIITTANSHVRSSTACPTYISQGNNIDIHMRAYPYGYITDYTSNSTGCFNIGCGNNDKTEYNTFVKSITGYSNAGDGYSGYVLNKKIGVTVVDRSNYKTQLATIYGNDSAHGVNNGWSKDKIAKTITEASGSWNSQISQAINLSPDLRYPAKIEAYSLSANGSFRVSETNGGARDFETVSFSEPCVINAVYNNGWCQVTFNSAGSQKTGYCPFSVFGNYGSIEEACMLSSQIIYKRSDLSQRYGEVSPNAHVWRIGKLGNSAQIICSVNSGSYIIGWVASSDSVHSHSYDSLTTVNDNTHKKTCSCGLSIMEAHVFEGSYYETAHPHKEYKKCACGAIKYTGTVKAQADCDECFPTHENIDINAPYIAVSSAKASAGDIVEISVVFKNNPGIIATCIQISYDDEALELVSSEDTGLLGTSSLISGNDINANPFTAFWMDVLAKENHDDDGTLLKLKFKIAGNALTGKYPISIKCDSASTYTIGFVNVVIATSDGIIEVCKSNNQVKYPEMTSVSLIKSYYESGDVLIKNCNGELLNDNDFVGSGSVISFKNSEETQTIIVSGDTNGDGLITTTDYLQIKSFFIGMYTLADTFYIAADTDNDGIITTTDYLRIKEYFLTNVTLYG